MLKPLLIAAASLGLALTAAAQTRAQSAPPAQPHSHAHGHSHDHKTPCHAHAHADAQGAKSVSAGYFDDAAVADRPLSDWAGQWQSVYPLLQEGRLDAVMAAKAASGAKTETELRAYYETGYRTDLTRIDIEGDRVTFHRGEDHSRAHYVADGHEILTYAKGNRGVRFIFRKTDGDAAAPAFLQFSDHIIAPQKSDHFHIYLGEDRAALLTEITNWPTFYPRDLSAEMIVEEMLGH